jgi:hypothetical protein
MHWYDLNARRLAAAEHAERLAADAAGPGRGRSRRRRWALRQLQLAAGLDLAARARHAAAHPQAGL